jgi:hypothetical protein
MAGLAITLMWIFAVAAFFFGAGTLASAPAITQQMAGLLMLVISAVFFVGAVIVGMLLRVRNDLRSARQSVPPPEPAAPPLAPVPKPPAPPQPVQRGPSASGEWEIGGQR